MFGPGYFERRAAALTEIDPQLGVTPRDDLLLRKLTVIYVAIENGQRTRTLEISEVENGTWREKVITVRLRGLILSQDGSFGNPEPLPTGGLAEIMHDPHKRLGYDFTIKRTAEAIDWAPKVGEAWNLTGGTAGMAAAFSVAKEIERDLAKGSITVRCGQSPRRVNMGRRQLTLANRKRQVPDQAGEQQFGFGDEAEQSGETENNLPLKVTVGGVRKVYRFKATFIADA
jgi:hypothetical protein